MRRIKALLSNDHALLSAEGAVLMTELVLVSSCHHYQEAATDESKLEKVERLETHRFYVTLGELEQLAERINGALDRMQRHASTFTPEKTENDDED